MSRAMSVYLDFLRALAAFAVLLAHLSQDGFSTGWIPLSRYSHEAVILFFVLSGHIIWTTSAASGRGALDYVAARAGRILSAAPAAVLLSLALAALVQIAEWPPPRVWRAPDIGEMLRALFFYNESWSASDELTLNSPYWSLCYEVWYYVLFGIFLYARGAWRWPLMIGAAALAGPAIVLLAPVWVLGAWLASRDSAIRMGPRLAWALFWGGMFAIILIDAMALENPARAFFQTHIPGFWRLDSSQRFATDYATALAVAANLAAFPHLSARAHELFLKAERPIRFFAGYSFSVYLFHGPMTQIGSIVAPTEWLASPVASLLIAFLMVGLCMGLGRMTEKQAPRLRRLFRAGLQAMLNRTRVPQGSLASKP